MIITCEACGTSYRLKTSMVKESGSKVRCSKCKHVFIVYPPSALADKTVYGSSNGVEGTATMEFFEALEAEARSARKEDARLRQEGDTISDLEALIEKEGDTHQHQAPSDELFDDRLPRITESEEEEISFSDLEETDDSGIVSFEELATGPQPATIMDIAELTDDSATSGMDRLNLDDLRTKDLTPEAHSPTSAEEVIDISELIADSPPKGREETNIESLTMDTSPESVGGGAADEIDFADIIREEEPASYEGVYELADLESTSGNMPSDMEAEMVGFSDLADSTGQTVDIDEIAVSASAEPGAEKEPEAVFDLEDMTENDEDEGSWDETDALGSGFREEESSEAEDDLGAYTVMVETSEFEEKGEEDTHLDAFEPERDFEMKEPPFNEAPDESEDREGAEPKTDEEESDLFDLDLGVEEDDEDEYSETLDLDLDEEEFDLDLEETVDEEDSGEEASDIEAFDLEFESGSEGPDAESETADDEDWALDLDEFDLDLDAADEGGETLDLDGGSLHLDVDEDEEFDLDLDVEEEDGDEDEDLELSVTPDEEFDLDLGPESPKAEETSASVEEDEFKLDLDFDFDEDEEQSGAGAAEDEEDEFELELDLEPEFESESEDSFDIELESVETPDLDDAEEEFDLDFAEPEEGTVASTETQDTFSENPEKTEEFDLSEIEDFLEDETTAVSAGQTLEEGADLELKLDSDGDEQAVAEETEPETETEELELETMLDEKENWAEAEEEFSMETADEEGTSEKAEKTSLESDNAGYPAEEEPEPEAVPPFSGEPQFMRRKRGWGRSLLIGLVVLIILAALAVGGMYYFGMQDRIPFLGHRATKPAVTEPETAAPAAEESAGKGAAERGPAAGVPEAEDTAATETAEGAAPEAADPGNRLITVTDNPDYRFVNNETAGELLVLTGSVTNKYDQARSDIKVEGRLYDQAGRVLRSNTVFVGNMISEADLLGKDLESLKGRLSKSGGNAMAGAGLSPGQDLPFMVVFGNLPDNLQTFDVEVVSSGKHLNQ